MHTLKVLQREFKEVQARIMVVDLGWSVLVIQRFYSIWPQMRPSSGNNRVFHQKGLHTKQRMQCDWWSESQRSPYEAGLKGGNTLKASIALDVA